ncbi:MAG: Unknown protein [uncultured Sulfurovum sp.]|uniref:Uncharacterized protein n=1 Tax=uncultured Sulfurovum sp. TaxID=269237 RepID=A0A6S6SE90_9BACT|nr:MAG: Unknown protein [uncultured Sulfurovum sp.]
MNNESQGVSFFEMIIQLEIFMVMFFFAMIGAYISYRLFSNFYKKKKYLRLLAKYGKDEIKIITFDKRGYPVMVLITDGDKRITKFI